MSHKAVSWALEQRDLKPAPWVVLIQLADRHNKDTLRCDPAQDRLAADCNMSRATVNRHLETLETSGFIRRVKRMNQATKKNLPTFYILGLNFDNPPEVDNAVSQNETRKYQVETGENEQSRVSNCDTEPCLKNEQSRVSKNANPVSQNETLTLVTKPGREPCAADAPHEKFDFDLIFSACPRKGSWEATEVAVLAEIEAGATPAELLSAAKAYRKEQAGNEPRFIKLSENFFAERIWKRYAEAPTARVDQETLIQNWAEDIIQRKPWAHTIRQNQARECILAGKVTPQQCQDAGIIV